MNWTCDDISPYEHHLWMLILRLSDTDLSGFVFGVLFASTNTLNQYLIYDMDMNKYTQMAMWEVIIHP